jgi:hypothetical protein
LTGVIYGNGENINAMGTVPVNGLLSGYAWQETEDSTPPTHSVEIPGITSYNDVLGIPLTIQAKYAGGQLGIAESFKINNLDGIRLWHNYPGADAVDFGQEEEDWVPAGGYYTVIIEAQAARPYFKAVIQQENLAKPYVDKLKKLEYLTVVGALAEFSTTVSPGNILIKVHGDTATPDAATGNPRYSLYIVTGTVAAPVYGDPVAGAYSDGKSQYTAAKPTEWLYAMLYKGMISDSTVDESLVVWREGPAAEGGIDDAPADGMAYGRVDNDWAKVARDGALAHEMLQGSIADETVYGEMVLQPGKRDFYFSLSSAIGYGALNLTLSVLSGAPDMDYQGRLIINTADANTPVTFPSNITWVNGTPNIGAAGEYIFDFLAVSFGDGYYTWYGWQAYPSNTVYSPGGKQILIVETLPGTLAQNTIYFIPVASTATTTAGDA